MIVGRVGEIGNGKTMLAVVDCLALAKRRNAVLVSSIWIVDSVPWGRCGGVLPDSGRVQLSVGVDGFDLGELDAVIDAAKAQGRGVVWLIDEIGILMPARFWQRFPIDLMYKLSQSRKVRLDVYWTSQDVEDVEAYLRRKTSYVYKVYAVPVPTIERQERNARPLFFYESKWKPGSVGKRDKRRGRRFVRYRRSYEALYDTDELVRPPARLAQKGRTPKGPASERWE